MEDTVLNLKLQVFLSIPIVLQAVEAPVSEEAITEPALLSQVLEQSKVNDHLLAEEEMQKPKQNRKKKRKKLFFSV